MSETSLSLLLEEYVLLQELAERPDYTRLLGHEKLTLPSELTNEWCVVPAMAHRWPHMITLSGDRDTWKQADKHGYNKVKHLQRVIDTNHMSDL